MPKLVQDLPSLLAALRLPLIYTRFPPTRPRPEADPPPPPLGGSPPRGLPFVSCIGEVGGKKKISALVGYSIRSHTIGSVRMRV